jgi:hypothetical protein
VAGSVDELLATTADREPWGKNVDSLSGSSFERVTVGGRPHIVKHLGQDSDWIMRGLGDGADGHEPWAIALWRCGLLDALPDVFDHTVTGAAWDPVSRRGALLMRDESAAFVPPGTAPVPLVQHRRFLDHMARMHARFWGFPDARAIGGGLLELAGRYTVLTPAMSAREAAAGYDDPVPKAVPGGWAALRAEVPRLYRLSTALVDDPTPLVDALHTTPHTFVHGDWKFGNLGSHADGRTVLVDWAWPGAAGPCVDLAWYLAVNCDRLPESKEDTVAWLRERLEHHGVDTTGWWERQLELALVGAFLQLGWSKTHDRAELGWWADRVTPVAEALLT